MTDIDSIARDLTGLRGEVAALKQFFGVPVATLTSVLPPGLTGATAYQNSDDVNEGPYWYTGTTWRRAWNMPWGLIAQTHASPGTTGITTGTDVLTLNFTATAGRYIVYVVMVNLQQQTGAGHQRVGIHNGSGFIGERTHQIAPAAGNFLTHTPASYPRNWSGALTWTVRCSTSANTCDVDGEVSMWVWDVGPQAAPA